MKEAQLAGLFTGPDRKGALKECQHRPPPDEPLPLHGHSRRGATFSAGPKFADKGVCPQLELNYPSKDLKRS